MPTSKDRVNISLPKDVKDTLVRLAERDSLPQATKALYLIRLALEIEEDDVWNAYAHKRDTSSAKFVSHKKVWGV